MTDTSGVRDWKILFTQVLDANGYVLSIDPDQVETFELDTPRDVHTLSEDPLHRELGKAHLNIHLHFKDGYVPTWQKVEN